MSIHIQDFYDQDTGTGTYVVHDSASRQAVIIDPVLHLDLSAGKVSTQLADAQLAWIEQQHLKLVYICDTHAHADHLSAAAYLKQRTGAKTVISRGIGRTQAHFAALFNKAPEADLTKLYDVLVDGGDTLMLGNIPIDIMATPGHTPRQCQLPYQR